MNYNVYFTEAYGIGYIYKGCLVMHTDFLTGMSQQFGECQKEQAFSGTYFTCTFSLES